MSPTTRKSAAASRRSRESADSGVCQHPGCNCPARSGESYCSDYCRTSKQGSRKTARSEGGCGCGHAACGEH